MDTKELIERLRHLVDNPSTWSEFDPPDSVVFANAASALASQAAEIARLREALTPSASTKAAYIGEFSFMVDDLGVDEDGDTFECQREITVPWTTVKEIMAAISARAALNGAKP